jgi:hypothetical protein
VSRGLLLGSEPTVLSPAICLVSLPLEAFESILKCCFPADTETRSRIKHANRNRAPRGVSAGAKSLPKDSVSAVTMDHQNLAQLFIWITEHENLRMVRHTRWVASAGMDETYGSADDVAAMTSSSTVRRMRFLRVAGEFG